VKYLVDASALTRILRRQADPAWADFSERRGLLSVAALAIRLQLTVLHEDRDFETVARFLPELKHHWLREGPPRQKAMSSVDG